MFPREAWWHKLLKHIGWKPSAYGHIPQVFYAKLENPPSKQDVWKKNNNVSGGENVPEYVGPKDYLYFVINASVGVGAKGKNNIKSVHIRFRIIPMHKGKSDPEVVYMYPPSMSQVAGTREVAERMEKQGNVGGSIAPSVPIPGFLLRLFGGLSYARYIEEKMNYILAYHVVTANASGTGNRAIWKFYQDRGMASIGQFDLKIYFRLLNTDLDPNWQREEVIGHLYCIDWNVEVNRKRLVDHAIDFHGNWNMKVNGRVLMDHLGNVEFNDKNNDLKYHQYWNVPLPFDSVTQFKNGYEDEDMLEKKAKDKRKIRKKMIKKMMNEEDSHTEPLKLLRPLYLLSQSSK